MLHHIDRTVGFDVGGYGDRIHNLEPLRAWLAAYAPSGWRRSSGSTPR